MEKEYILIKSKKYKLILLLDEMDFDYYTDVCVELVLMDNL